MSVFILGALLGFAAVYVLSLIFTELEHDEERDYFYVHDDEATV